MIQLIAHIQTLSALQVEASVLADVVKKIRVSEMEISGVTTPHLGNCQGSTMRVKDSTGGKLDCSKIWFHREKKMKISGYQLLHRNNTIKNKQSSIG